MCTVQGSEWTVILQRMQTVWFRGVLTHTDRPTHADTLAWWLLHLTALRTAAPHLQQRLSELYRQHAHEMCCPDVAQLLQSVLAPNDTAGGLELTRSSVPQQLSAMASPAVAWWTLGRVLTGECLLP